MMKFETRFINGLKAFRPSFSTDAKAFRTKFSLGVCGGGGIAYTGDYEVTPKAETETVLSTKNKTMLKDVKVLKIPTFETSNQHGTTFYIANIGG